MKINIGKTLSDIRRAKKFMQKDIANNLVSYGIEVSTKTIYNWEKEIALPNARQFIALCDILGINDPLWEFAGIQKGAYSGLNQDGRQKAQEFIDILYQVETYRYMPIERDEQELNEPSEQERKYINLYDIPAAAGDGEFLDNVSYEEIEVDEYVPDNASFAIRVSGNSMEPRFVDKQIVFIKRQETLDVGEFGIFVLNGDSFIKKLGKNELVSLNPEYKPIRINESDSFHIFGKVVGV